MNEFSLPLSANTTYSISREHSIGTTITIPENVTLIFQGGKLTGSGKLIGNNTKIVAPISQIFGESLNVTEGSWCVDRAYPQWFGAKIVERNLNGDITNGTVVDSSTAINKAIKFKRTGEVFLSRGEYAIGSTIYVKFGIVLCGEKGGRGDGIENGYVGGDAGNLATMICPIKSNTNQIASNIFKDGFMIRVNVDENNDNGTWKVGYPVPATVIKDMTMLNRNTLTLNGYDRSGLKKLRGIYAAGNIEISNIVWDSFLQAFSTSSEYSDLRKITGCTFNNWEVSHHVDGEPDDEIYAFDITFLGDGLVFENNGIHKAYNDLGVHLFYCGGGNITSNIINAKVHIEACKGISFESNHVEDGFSAMVLNSNVRFSNNFIFKGPEPAITIKGSEWTDISTVTFNNDVFIFYDKGGDKTLSTNEYDLKMDGYVSVQLLNTYRYWFADSFGTMHTLGIKICDNEGKSIDNFNNYSYLLSGKSGINTNYEVVNSGYINNLDSRGAYQHPDIHTSDFTTWLGNTDSYNYKTQTIWDDKRKIANNVSDFGNGPISVTQGKGGIFIPVASLQARNCIIRFYRKRTNQSTMQEYVDVPICGTSQLFDNGISICGYKWKPIPSDNSFESMSQHNILEKISFEGNNIKCVGTNLPLFGKWEKGDIFIQNNGNNVTSYFCVTAGSLPLWRRMNA